MLLLCKKVLLQKLEHFYLLLFVVESVVYVIMYAFEEKKNPQLSTNNKHLRLMTKACCSLYCANAHTLPNKIYVHFMTLKLYWKKFSIDVAAASLNVLCSKRHCINSVLLSKIFKPQLNF